MMRAEREQRFNEFVREALPKRQHESWKYTDVSFIAKTAYVAAERPCDEPYRDVIGQYRLPQPSIMLVFVNGYYMPALSDPLPQGVTAGSVEQLDRFKQYASQPIDDAKHPFASLNQRIFNDSFVLEVAANVCVDPVIHLLSLTVDSVSFASHPRRLIIMGGASGCTLFEECISISSRPNLFNTLTYFELADSAKVDYCKLQANNQQVAHLASTFVNQKADSDAQFAFFTTGVAFARDDVSVHLQQRGANCRTAGMYRLHDAGQYVDHHIDITHDATHSESEMLFKGVIDKQAKAVFNGRLLVSENAQKTKAYQANHHILLSDQAEAYSKPELEIYADDVKCKHGATSGQINDDALFYLRSRGMNGDEAKALLLRAFAHEVLDKITNPIVRGKVAEALLLSEVRHA